MKTIKSVKEMVQFSARVKERGQKLAFIPTMGALHEGHLSLVEAAKGKADVIVISIFVNPTQFAPNEDFSSYPRSMDRDKLLLKPFEPVVLFHPSPDELYRENFNTWVEEDVISRKLCGKFRMGHFKGVTTILAKLFNIVRPDLAYFGEKDYQQQLIVKKMVRDLNYPIEIVVCPTVREYDGLALSSRNQRLSEKERKSAGVLYKALIRTKKDIESGESDSRRIVLNIGRMLGFEPLVRVDYISIVDPNTLDEIKEIKGKVLVAIAVRLGKTRLIDSILAAPK